MRSMWVFFCSLFFSIGVSRSFGSVVLIGNNVTVSFENTESNFAPLVKGSGKCGILYVADPLDACSPLTNKVSSKLNDPRSPFVLIIRGGCSFEDKVRTVQTAGFRAAIVYDNENGALIAMAGHSIGINIPAVFVSKISGETLRDYASMADLNLWILPSFQNTAWSIMGISFISLLAMMCAVVVSCFFVRRHRHRGRRRERHRAPRVQEFLGMSSRLVKAMPSVIFTAELENNCASKTCTICLEDYIVGEKLRILPCCHMFHANCVDTWLTSWRTFCPICKRDARSHEGNPPSAEYTPLLSTLVSSSSPLSSYRSSSATEFGPSFSLPSSVSHPQPASETHCNQLHHQNTAQTVPDPSSQRSFIAFVGHYPLSPLNSRCPSPYPPGNGSYI